jgi:MSHA biogenesis protein MshO
MMNRIKMQGTRNKAKRPWFSQRGFTLVEMIMVIVITGIIGGMVAVFLQAPIKQYLDVSRRADMTDIADTALRRIGRDIRLALPNSVRVTSVGSNTYLEFLPTSGGGRYRFAPAPTGTSAGCGSLSTDMLDFTKPDNCFEVLGNMPTLSVNDQIVVYNLGIARPATCPAPLPAQCGSDAYQGDNRAAFASYPTATTISIAARQFPFDSPSHRFQVIDTPVTYVCSAPGTNAAGNGTGQLLRWQGYAIQVTQPTTLPATGTPSFSVLANNVSACNFSYNGFVVAQRSGLVTINLGITESNDQVTLYSAAHVSNVP